MGDALEEMKKATEHLQKAMRLLPVEQARHLLRANQIIAGTRQDVEAVLKFSGALGK